MFTKEKTSRLILEVQAEVAAVASDEYLSVLTDVVEQMIGNFWAGERFFVFTMKELRDSGMIEVDSRFFSEAGQCYQWVKHQKSPVRVIDMDRFGVL